MNKFIPLSVPNLKGNEKKYVNEAIDAEWVSTAGAFVEKFEQEIAAYLQVETACACQSGTAGIHLALLASDVGADDEVIVPTLTFIAAVNPVTYVGAAPVFMDCDDSLCMDPVKLKKFCEEECIFTNGKLLNERTGKHIKALIVVHIFGNMADMEAIVDIAEKYNLALIEDATEAMGTRYERGRFCGKYAGTIGDIGVYSFNGNKIITTGGGGAVVAKSKKTLDRIKHLSTQAKSDPQNFEHDSVGYNYRMTNVQAAMGVAQLEQLESFIETKKSNYFRYIDQGIDLLDFRAGIRPNYWFYSYICRNKPGQTDAPYEMIEHLKTNGVQARPIWGLIHEQNPYTKAQSYCIEKAYEWRKVIVNIPCSSNLSGEDVDYVCKVMKEKEQ